MVMLMQSVKRYYSQFLLVLILSLFMQLAYAEQLPPVTGASYNGEQISWNALPDATGYNIYLDFEYIDTVVGTNTTTYSPSQLGEYQIAAYDDNGRFSPLQVILAGVLPTTNIADVTSLPEGLVIEQPTVEVEPPSGNTEQLPPVTGVAFDGSEITWDELAGATGYNVYIGLTYIDTVSEGTSFIPQASGEYRIVGFDDDGRFSPLYVIDVNVVQISNFVVVNLGDPPIDDRPNMPQNLSILSYSDNTAELFWDRPSLDENVVNTQVFRDGVFLGGTTGISFLDMSRSSRSSTFHQYELVAINVNGGASLPAILNLGAFDGITEEEVLALMEGVSDVTNDNPHVRWFSTLRSLTGGNNPLSLLSAESFLDDNNLLINRITYTCEGDNPGTLVIDKIDSRFGIDLLDFDSCTINGTSFFGGVSIVGSDIGGYNASYDELEISDININYLSGAVSLSIGRAVNFATLTYTDFDYSIMGNPMGDDENELDTAVVMNQQVTDGFFSDVRSTFTSNISVSAPWTRGERLDVATTEQFTGADLGAGNYLTGEMAVTSATGNGAFISAATGDAQTWSVDVVTDTNNFNVTGGWAETGKLPCLTVTQGESALEGCTLR